MLTHGIYLYEWLFIPLILLCLFLYRYRFGFKWVAAKRGLKEVVLWNITCALLLAAGIRYSRLEESPGAGGANNFDFYCELLSKLAPILLSLIAYLAFQRGYNIAITNIDSTKKYNHFVLSLLTLCIFIMISESALALRTQSLSQNIQHASTPNEIRDLSKDPLITDNMEPMLSLLNNPNIPSDVLERWYHNGKGDEGMIARHPHTPASVLAELAASKSGVYYSYEIARNPNVSAVLLAKLSHVEPHAVALSPYASLELLEKLSRNPDPDIRSAVGMNENASCAILRRLANDSELKRIPDFEMKILLSNYENKCGSR